MSNAALRWAFTLPVTGPKKAVLLALADHADDAGECWPSIARLVLFSGIQERAVRNALRDMEDARIIVTDRSSGRATSHYTLSLNAAPDAALAAASTRHVAPRSVQNNPAPDAPSRHVMPGSDASNPAPDAGNPAPHAPNPAPDAPEPSLTPIEPPKRTVTADAELIADAVSIWNSVCGRKLPSVQKLTDQRKKALASRLREDFAGNVANWRVCCEMIAASDFLTTGNGTWPGATFDWVLKPANMTKILEGNYTNRKPAAKADPLAWLDEPSNFSSPEFDMEATADDYGTFRSH